MPDIDHLSSWTHWSSGLSNPYLVGNDNSGTTANTYKFSAYSLCDEYLANHMGRHFSSSHINDLDSHIGWLLFNRDEFARTSQPPLIDTYLSESLGSIFGEAVSAADEGRPHPGFLSEYYLPMYYDNQPTLTKCNIYDLFDSGLYGYLGEHTLSAYLDEYMSENLASQFGAVLSNAGEIPSSYIDSCVVPLYYEGTLYYCDANDLPGGGGGGNFEADMEEYLFALPDYTDPETGIDDNSCCFFAMNKGGGYPSKLNFNNHVYNYFGGLVSVSTADLSDSDEIYLGGRYNDSSQMLKITLGELISYIQNH